ncbi:MAG TPA: class I SAM-dependent methyltransferase [Candidatus Binatia bacterium]|nr:class I SAM-dependent methyltransferase [Candidatus Binatia bacterium]
MSLQDRLRWEARHQQARLLAPRRSLSLIPKPAQAAAPALDVACGQGRHSLALAARGYRVVSVDVSRHALMHLRSSSIGGAPAIVAVQADLDHWPFRAAAFDVVVQIDFLDRRLLPALAASLRPSGTLLIDTFLLAGHRNEDGPNNADFMLLPGELPLVYRDLDILHYAEEDAATARATLLARRRS